MNKLDWHKQTLIFAINCDKMKVRVMLDFGFELTQFIFKLKVIYFLLSQKEDDF